jgi:UDP:flavonoid glycosyltransferase YjiC (YdhE family)
MNLLLYPEPIKFKRREPLDPSCFQYLEGCVREEAAFEVPVFQSYNSAPLLYVSFGSLGSGDTILLKRLMDAVEKMPVRALLMSEITKANTTVCLITSRLHHGILSPQSFHRPMQ